eukprot:g5019.t1
MFRPTTAPSPQGQSFYPPLRGSTAPAGGSEYSQQGLHRRRRRAAEIDDDMPRLNRSMRRLASRARYGDHVPLTMSKVRDLLLPPAMERMRAKPSRGKTRLWKPADYSKGFLRGFERSQEKYSSCGVWQSTKLQETLHLATSANMQLPCRMLTMVAANLFVQVYNDPDIALSLPRNFKLRDKLRVLLASTYPAIHPRQIEHPPSVSYRSVMEADEKNDMMTLLDKLEKIPDGEDCLDWSELELLRLILDEGCMPSTLPIRQQLGYSPCPPRSREQSLDQMSVRSFATFRSWFEHEKLLLEEIAEEESWKPIMEAYYRKAWEEREKTIAVLTRSTRAWQISVQGVIFRRWAEALVKVRDSREKMVQFLHRMKGVSAKEAFKAWRALTRKNLIDPIQKAFVRMEDRISSSRKRLETLVSRIDILRERMTIQKQVLQQLSLELSGAKQIVARPDRDPMTLHRIVRKFIMSLIAMHASMGKASRFSAQQLRRSGLGSHRVGASTFLPETVSDIQEVAERGIWTSKSELETGRLHADEDITYPFDTRVGRTMLLWLNAELGSSSSSYISSFLDIRGGAAYAQLLGIAEKITKNGSKKRMQELVCTRAAELSPSLSFLSVNDLAELEDMDEESSEEEEVEEQGLRGARRRNSPTKVRVRLTTFIDGRRVEMEDDIEQRNFAFLSQLFTQHKSFAPYRDSEDPSQGWSAGAFAGRDDDDLAWQGYKLDALMGDLESVSISLKNIKKGCPARTPKDGLSSTIDSIWQGVETLKSNLLDSIRDVQARGELAETERANCRDFENRAVYLSWSSMYMSMLGRDTELEEDTDDGTFTHLQQEQIRDIFKLLPSASGSQGLTVDEIATTMKKLKEFFVLYLRKTKMLFEHYAAAGSGGKKETMDRGEYMRMLRDCGFNKIMSSAESDLIFQKANLDYSLDNVTKRDAIDRAANPDGELTGNEFIEVVVRLAIRIKGDAVLCKASSLHDENDELVMMVEKLYEEDLLKHAQRTDKNAFREAMADDQVKRTFFQFEIRKKLKRIFAYYARADTSDSAAGSGGGGGSSSSSSSSGSNSSSAMNVSTVNVKELIKMCRDLKIIRPRRLISDTLVRTLFARVQMPSDSSEDVSKDVSENDDAEMVYEEFKELMGALTIYSIPDPLEPLHKRLLIFLNELFDAFQF